MLRAVPILFLITLAVVPSASAATARFTGTFEAERTSQWDQPRGVSEVSCAGEHFYAANGSDSWKVKSRGSFKVVVTSMGRFVSWQFGTPRPRDPLRAGVEAAGMRKREFNVTSGTTGGWCSPGLTMAPKRPDDCGGRLPTHLVNFMALGGKVQWTLGTAPWMANEKVDYYDCTLVVPDGLPVSSFPDLVATYKTKDLFNKRKKSIDIGVSKDYGPDSWPVPNLGVNRTASGSVSWKLKLTRAR